MCLAESQSFLLKSFPGMETQKFCDGWDKMVELFKWKNVF